MTLIEEHEEMRTAACDDGERRCPVDRDADNSLFRRPWDAFVARLDADGRYRTFVECCGELTPA